MTLTTKPRWDKYDGYVGNFRAHLAADIDLATQANKVLAVGIDSNGAITIGSGQTGIKGLMIVAVAADIHGNLLDGGINNQAGDPQDVGKHGEITNFVPTKFTNSTVITITDATGGTWLPAVNGKPVSAAVANNVSTANLQTALNGIDDGVTGITVTGTAGSSYTITHPAGVTISADGSSLTGDETPTIDVQSSSAAGAAGTNYYGHADGSVDSVKGADGVYVGHTAELGRLIVNVDDQTS